MRSALRSLLTPFALVVSLALAAPAAAQTTFTFPQILGYPFPTELVASPAEPAIAWVFTQHGVRNIWIARAPDSRRASSPPTPKDDGQELTNLGFSEGRHAPRLRARRRPRRRTGRRRAT